MEKLKEFLSKYQCMFNEGCSQTYTISFVDLFTSDEFYTEFTECLENEDHTAFKELLYKVGVDINKDIHITIKDHRPISDTKIHRDYMIFYYARTDRWWMKNGASVEQLIDSSCAEMKLDLKRIKNEVNYGNEDGSLKEWSLKDTTHIAGTGEEI